MPETLSSVASLSFGETLNSIERVYIPSALKQSMCLLRWSFSFVLVSPKFHFRVHRGPHLHVPFTQLN
jgi:hypothetical protein